MITIEVQAGWPIFRDQSSIQPPSSCPAPAPATSCGPRAPGQGPHTATIPSQPSSLTTPTAPHSLPSQVNLSSVAWPGSVSPRLDPISILPAIQTASSLSLGSPLMRIPRANNASLLSLEHREEDRPSLYSNEYYHRYSDSDRSEQSNFSASTAPTEYDYRDHQQPHVKLESQQKPVAVPFQYCPNEVSPRASIETYASSVASLEPPPVTESEFVLPDFHPDEYCDNAVPTTPADFSKLFPSARKLVISHDDASPDGNMNLKVGTEVPTLRGRLQNMTLFYLRIYDLKTREFSLRRYDRNSGREVCHSVREYVKPCEHARPTLHKTLSNAIAMFRAKSEQNLPAKPSLISLNRSGGSIGSLNLQEENSRPGSAGSANSTHARVPMDTDRLEFSNYAKVMIKQRGARQNRRYEFEYWGTTYQWKHMIVDGEDEQFCCHLSRIGSTDVLAKIVPEPLSPSEKRHELEKGGWVPPCAMWINDESLIRAEMDVAE